MTYFTPRPRPPFHRTTESRPPGRVLEVSSRSPLELGRQLSAMNLRAAGDPHHRCVEAIYQAAKVYGDAGPGTPAASGYEAKRLDRDRRRQGPLTGFEHAGRRWDLATGTAFYDWLWTRSALAAYGPALVERLQDFSAFTDQFHRAGAKACQAKTAAIVAGMAERAREASATPDAWLLAMNPARPKTDRTERLYAGIGSRATPEPVLEHMQRLARAMAKAGWVLRSGAAQGADSAFETGARDADGRREIWIPWNRYNDRTPEADPTVRIARHDDTNRAIAAKRHPRWDHLGPGAQKLMVRNVHQVLGEDPENPARVDVVICWTDGGRGSGGTGMALRLAADHRIPIIDLGADRTRLARSVAQAVDHGLPETVAQLITTPQRTTEPADATTHRIVVTGDCHPADRIAIHAHLAKLAAKHPALTIVPAGQSAGDAAIAWAEANGHRVDYPSPRSTTDREPPSTRAARILDPRPDLVLDCSAHWDFRAQSLVLAAEADSIPATRCLGIDRQATPIEHQLNQAKAERRKAPPAGPEPPAKIANPAGRYAAVDQHAETHLDAEGSRIARAAVRRHRLTQPHLLERALHVANSPNKDVLLGAESWTTRDRMEHDPLGTLTAGIDPPALRQVLAAARTIANALRRAHLERAASRTVEPDPHGTRQKLVAREQHLTR